MNQLSKLLYLASVCDRLGGFFCLLSIICIVAFGILLLVGAIACEELEENQWKIWRRIGYVLVPMFFVSFFLNAIVPSKDTVYAIAASQLGEKALQTPLAGKAEQALEAWLNSKIKQATAPVQAAQ